MSDNLLSNFGNNLNVAVIGASGGLGRSITTHLCAQSNVSEIHAFSRSETSFDHKKVQNHRIDITSEESIKTAVSALKDNISFDIIIVATGLLHDDAISPEKTMRDLNFEHFQDVFAVNTFGPALLAKYFLTLIPRKRRSVFACLSARVGSISDNQLGGWYAYRASKAALNMLLKNLAIETARRYQNACILGLHPGTVNTALSQPFQSNVQDGKLFTPEYSSTCLLRLINDADPNQSGTVLAWDGKEVPA